MSDFIISELKNTYEKGLEKRLTIDGVTKNYESYKLPIKKLYYNDLNGRIASYIEEYNLTNEKNISDLYANNLDEYNKIIAKYIIDSASDGGKSFEETKEDIRNKGQEIPGVILSDGRIIDGNRRFTALRKLYEETGNEKYAYFEAVCLKAPEKDDVDGWKRIKSLELNLQFNVNEKKGYNRIDELVSFYRDAVDAKTKMFDEKSYCFASGISKSKFNKDKKIVNIMLDYLDWRGKPKAFYILKNEKLDGPIEELAPLATKMSAEEWNLKKETLYMYMTINDDGDRTRDIRELIKSAQSEGLLYNEVKDKFESEEIYTKAYDYINKIDTKSDNPTEEIEKESLKKELTFKLQDAYKEGTFQSNITDASTKPLDTLDRAIKLISKIDNATIKWLSKDVKCQINTKLDCLISLLNKIKEVSDD